jgi:hypothetical protein
MPMEILNQESNIKAISSLGTRWKMREGRGKNI